MDELSAVKTLDLEGVITYQQLGEIVWEGMLQLQTCWSPSLPVFDMPHELAALSHSLLHQYVVISLIY